LVCLPGVDGARTDEIEPEIIEIAAEDEAMSDESEVEKVLLRAGELKFLGRDRAFVTLLFALWAARKKGGLLSALTKVAILAGGVGGCAYWNGFFS
jgi:hypothetical protein